METARSPKFPGNPHDHSPCSSDPGVTRHAGGSKCRECLTRPPRASKTRAHDKEISRLNHIAFDLAVYASQRKSPATTQDSLPAAGPALPDGIGYPLGSNERFHICDDSPFPSFLAQGRDPQWHSLYGESATIRDIAVRPAPANSGPDHRWLRLGCNCCFSQPVSAASSRGVKGLP